MGGGAKRMVTFLYNISQTKKCIWAFFHCLMPQKRGGGGEKPSKLVYMREKVKVYITEHDFLKFHHNIVFHFLKGTHYMNHGMIQLFRYNPYTDRS
jgi:hypothetical protein